MKMKSRFEVYARIKPNLGLVWYLIYTLFRDDEEEIPLQFTRDQIKFYKHWNPKQDYPMNKQVIIRIDNTLNLLRTLSASILIIFSRRIQDRRIFLMLLLSRSF